LTIERIQDMIDAEKPKEDPETGAVERAEAADGEGKEDEK
jgi:hypothetical protein